MATKKRANGEGSIGKYKDGWRGRYTFTSTGKRQAVYGGTQKEVAKKIAELRKEDEAGLHNTTDADQPFRTFALAWIDAHKNLEPKTEKGYRCILRHHFDGIGDTPLNKLKPAMIQAHYTRKLKTQASTSVHHIHTFFHVVLEHAVKLELIPRNPSDHVDAPPIKSKEICPLTEEQAKLMLQAIKGDRYEALYALALATGMREAELLGLRWQDINFDKKLIRVAMTLHRIKGVYDLRKTKSRGSKRTLPLPDYAIQLLKEHRLRQTEELSALKEIQEYNWDLIFTTVVGAPLHPTVALKRFQKLIEKVGIPKTTRFHDIRHTFATLLLERGVHIKAVSELLGHSSVDITLRVYGHVTPRMQDTALIQINSLMSE
jgi:integrase